MSLVLLLVCALLSAAAAAHFPYRSPVFVDENSLSPVARYGGPVSYEERNWVKIKHSGPRMNRLPQGGQLELECEANGSPPPVVQWYRNGNPVSPTIDENNSIPGGVRLGNVISRLVVDCVTSTHQGSYTCVAVAGTESAVSQPSLVFVQGKNSSGLVSACTHSQTSPPRIVTWSPNIMETMGNDALLPCVSVGSPRPQVYWVDGHNHLITSDSTTSVEANERYQVLESGDLMISAVRWADMGHFTCVAESPLGRDTVTTFLYPMAPDSKR